MDIDYHFGTIYVLSRWAGFGSGNAKVIAAASQFVDDNVSDDPKVWATAKEVTTDGVIRYSGHELWENLFNEEGNEQVWIPYHFLPGLEGDSEDERLVCKKNSVLANELAERLNSISLDDSNYAFKLGIGLHVYADTWAHQEFAGITSIANIVKDLVVELFSEDSWQSLEQMQDMVKNIALDLAAPLGHAAAIHWPDRPYAKWKSMAKFPDGRDNCEEFMEASEAIYKILAHVHEDVPPELDTAQKNVLKKAFLEIQDDDPEKRNAIWLQWISDNIFGLDEYSDEDEHLEYSKYFILSDEDFPKQFYESLDDHYNWVKSRLDAEGITRLEE
jgi:hypothetical protein